MAIQYRKSSSAGKKWNRIKRIREHVGMSREHLARAADVSQQYVYFMEADGSIGNNPSPEIREKIRKARSKKLWIELTLDEIWPANVCDRDVEVVDTHGVIF